MNKIQKNNKRIKIKNINKLIKEDSLRINNPFFSNKF